MPNVSFAATVVPTAKNEMTAVDQTVEAGMETMAAPADETPPMGIANIGVIVLIEITIETTTRYNMQSRFKFIIVIEESAWTVMGVDVTKKSSVDTTIRT